MNRSASVDPQRRRAWLARAIAGAALVSARPVHALMAGQAPDTPAARVDPNNASSPWAGVVSVTVNGSPYSGVAVAPSHVLTAAHVVAAYAPANVQVVLNHGTPAQTSAVASIIVYPGANFPYDDLALLQLTQPLPSGVAIYSVLDVPQPPGTRFTLVGYGASGNGNAGVTVPANASIKRTGQNSLDQYASSFDSSGRSSPFYVYDFDGPSGVGPYGGSTLGNSVETTVAVGDSGSGAFVTHAGAPALLGLNTIALGASGVPAQTFGTGGAGIVLNHGPYLDWLAAQTAGAVALASRLGNDSVPAMPVWAMALLGSGLLLGGRLAQRRTPRAS